MAEEKKTNHKLINYGDSQLIKDAGSLSLFTPQGTPDDVDSYADVNLGAKGAKLKRVPGIEVIDYMIVPGRSEDGSSALNMAAKKLYTFVRHANSGSRNYDSPDLMNFAFSGVSLFTFIAQAQRAYGCMIKWKGKNRYYGEKLVKALGFDYGDLEGKLADFRMAINLAVKKLNAIKIPTAWPLWNKNWLINSILLKDGDIDRSQIYAFRSTVIWQYNETGTYVGSLTPYFVYGSTESNLIDLSDFNLIIDTIVNSFVASEDINIMSGDIVKAYGEDKCLELPVISEDYEIEPMYDRSLLEVIHNTTVFEVSKTYSSNAGCIIYQDSNNALIFDPVVVGTDVYGKVTVTDKYEGTGVVTLTAFEREYLDFYRDDVTPEDVINASIMTVMPFGVQDQDGVYQYGKFYNFGTEIAINAHIYCIKDDGTGFESIVNPRRRYFYNAFTGDHNHDLISGISLAKVISTLSRFDWHERIAFIGSKTYVSDLTNIPVGDFAAVYAMYDLYNYTVVTATDLLKLHDVHVLGGFGLLD